MKDFARCRGHSYEVSSRYVHVVCRACVDCSRVSSRARRRKKMYIQNFLLGSEGGGVPAVSEVYWCMKAFSFFS